MLNWQPLETQQLLENVPHPAYTNHEHFPFGFLTPFNHLAIFASNHLLSIDFQ
jgi:hypothetical protein